MNSNTPVLGLDALHIAMIMAVIAVLALICNIIYNRISKKTYKISKSEHDSKLPNFGVYLINSFRLSIKENSKKYLFFNITVSNKSTIPYSFTARLEIQFIREDNSTDYALIDHIHLNIKSKLVEKLTIFPNEIRLAEKAIESKWLIFEYPNDILKSYRIAKYLIKIQDIDGNNENIEVFLIKDISDEN